MEVKTSKKCSAIRVQCCNPLKKSNHCIRDRKKLRYLTAWMPDLFPQIPNGSMICDKCRKDVGKLKSTGPISEAVEDSSGLEVIIRDKDPNFTTNAMVVETFNTTLQELEMNRIIIRFNQNILEGVRRSLIRLKSSIKTVDNLIEEIKFLFNIQEDIYLSLLINDEEVYIPPKSTIDIIDPGEEVVVNLKRDNCLKSGPDDDKQSSAEAKKKKRKRDGSSNDIDFGKENNKNSDLLPSPSKKRVKWKKTSYSAEIDNDGDSSIKDGVEETSNQANDDDIHNLEEPTARNKKKKRKKNKGHSKIIENDNEREECVQEEGTETTQPPLENEELNNQGGDYTCNFDPGFPPLKKKRKRKHKRRSKMKVIEPSLHAAVSVLEKDVIIQERKTEESFPQIEQRLESEEFKCQSQVIEPSLHAAVSVLEKDVIIQERKTEESFPQIEQRLESKEFKCQSQGELRMMMTNIGKDLIDGKDENDEIPLNGIMTDIGENEGSSKTDYDGNQVKNGGETIPDADGVRKQGEEESEVKISKSKLRKAEQHKRGKKKERILLMTSIPEQLKEMWAVQPSPPPKKIESIVEKKMELITEISHKEFEPVIGDTISFQRMKISKDYCPEISKTVVGKVVGIEGSALEIIILSGLEEFCTPCGKFSLDDEQEPITTPYRTKLLRKDLIKPSILQKNK